MNYASPTYNVLIADDHQLIIDGLCGILNDEKSIATIYSAKNGQEAIDLVMNNSIDCVLMDINMPLVNGLEATKIIKQKREILMKNQTCPQQKEHFVSLQLQTFPQYCFH